MVLNYPNTLPEARLPGLNAGLTLYKLCDLGPSYLTVVCLDFLTSKMGVIIYFLIGLL